LRFAGVRSNHVGVRSSFVLGACAILLGTAALGACNESGPYVEPGPRPVIVGVEGPSLEDGGARDSVACNVDSSDGSCPITLKVTFRLSPEHFVWKAFLRFDGDGNDTGIDRGYLVSPQYGVDGGTQTVEIRAAVPPTVLGRGGLLTYSVRLLTGAGQESDPSSQVLTVEKIRDAGADQ